MQAAIITAVATGTTALIALLGVTLSLRSNRRSEREERYLNLKREVYLEAAHDYAAAVQLLGAFHTPEHLNSDQTQEISRAFGSSVGKILLVGNDRSIKAWLKLQTQFAGILARTAASGMQLQAAQRAFSEKKAEFEKSLSDAGKQSSPFGSLMAGLDYYKETLSQLKKMMDEAETLLPLSIEATLAAKEELSIHVDEAEFTKLSEQASKELREIIKGLVREINARISSELESFKSGKQEKPASKIISERSDSKAAEFPSTDASQLTSDPTSRVEGERHG